VTGEKKVSEEITNRLIAANRSYFGLKVSLSHRYFPGSQKFLNIKHLWGQYLHILQEPGLCPKKDERRLSIFDRKILCRIYGLICEEGQWQKRYSRELEELYDVPDIVKVIKSSILRWVGHVVRMDENELSKKLSWTNPGGQWGRGQPKSRWIDGVDEDARKVGCRNWRVDARDRGHWQHLHEEAKTHPGL
jgi:hypothetical protein